MQCRDQEERRFNLEESRFEFEQIRWEGESTLFEAIQDTKVSKIISKSPVSA